MFVKFFVVFNAILIAYLLYVFVVEPKILDRLCLTNNEACLKVSFWKIDGSVLLHMQPAGFWVWVNGDQVYVYSKDTGRICTDLEHEPAYTVNSMNGQPNGYECITKLETLISYYKERATKQYIYHRVPKDKLEGRQFGILDLVNLLKAEKMII